MHRLLKAEMNLEACASLVEHEVKAIKESMTLEP